MPAGAKGPSGAVRRPGLEQPEHSLDLRSRPGQLREIRPEPHASPPVRRGTRGNPPGAGIPAGRAGPASVPRTAPARDARSYGFSETLSNRAQGAEQMGFYGAF